MDELLNQGPRNIDNWGAHIFTERTNNKFQKKFITSNTNT